MNNSLILLIHPFNLILLLYEINPCLHLINLDVNLLPITLLPSPLLQITPNPIMDNPPHDLLPQQPLPNLL